jgi:hypothetical protein
MPTSSETRAALDGNHQQLDDPAKRGAPMLTLIEAETPPLRFATFSDWGELKKRTFTHAYRPVDLV